MSIGFNQNIAWHIVLLTTVVPIFEHVNEAMQAIARQFICILGISVKVVSCLTTL